MKITYFYRNPQCGFSIQRVFQTLTNEIEKYAEVEEAFVPSKRSLPWDVIINCIFVFKNRNKTGINHITGHIHETILALLGLKTVVTIHDLVFLDNVRNPFKKFYKWLFWLYLPLKLSDKVVCISTETKRRILTHMNSDKLSVIYNSIDDSFSFSEKEFNEDKPLILHIGTSWNKNLSRTIQALEGISCHLRIIGEINETQLAALKKHKIEYSNAFSLSDEEIKQEYINCDLINFPSEYEGFGMPIVEGQKTGRVVITSKIEPLIEVSGNAVAYVDPLSVKSIRDAYLEVIKHQEIREKIIRDGLKNTARFEVAVIAQQYIDLYKTLKPLGIKS